MRATQERKRFAKGVGVGTCAGCGRSYRPTLGRHLSGSADGYYTSEEAKEQAAPFFADAIERGGSAERLAEYFPELWGK